MLESRRLLGVVGLSWALLAGCSSDPSDGGTGGTSAQGGSDTTGEGGAAGTDGDGGAGGDTVAGSAGQTQPGPPVQLRVATFNVENFFNDKKDSPGVTDETVVTTSAYQTKLAGVAAILAKTNADIVMLEEVENDSVLSDLQARPEFKGKFVERVILPGNDPRGISVAALSTVPFTSKISHKDEQFTVLGTTTPKYRWSRDLLELHATVNTRHLVFLGVHLKAKVDDDPSKRLAEAQRARAVADKIRKNDPAAGVVILGDFNDFPGTAPINAVEQGTPVGGEVYGSAGLLQPAADAWSVKSSSAPGGLALHDDLRSSPWLQDRIVKGSSLILHDTQLDKPLQSISDHAPVVITYRID